MSTHTIQTEIEVRSLSRPGRGRARDGSSHRRDHLRLFARQSCLHAARGITPIDPPEPPGLAFRAAKYIGRDGLESMPRLQECAEEWLLGHGYDYACDCAELDLAAQKHAHLEQPAVTNSYDAEPRDLDAQQFRAQPAAKGNLNLALRSSIQEAQALANYYANLAETWNCCPPRWSTRNEPRNRPSADQQPAARDARARR